MFRSRDKDKIMGLDTHNQFAILCDNLSSFLATQTQYKKSLQRNSRQRDFKFHYFTTILTNFPGTAITFTISFPEIKF